MAKKPKNTQIKTLTHDGNTRPNIPTAELENLVRDEEVKPVKVDYSRKNNPDKNPEIYTRNRDLDPQLVWQGKDEEDCKPLSVDAVPIYVQEHIHPKVIIEDIKRQAQKNKIDSGEETPDLFTDWDGELSLEDKIEFYQHEQKWTNRMILGDSLQAMTSLREKEKLRRQVQCIYFDPPYGINFSSNWQPTTSSNRVGNRKSHEPREPEVIRAFRDTWQNGINSYLSYLRDRLVVARDLLTESGSIFVQIGNENVHLVRSLMDEVFDRRNFQSQISFKKSTPLGTNSLPSTNDYILWFAKNYKAVKFRKLYEEKQFGAGTMYRNLRLPSGEERKMTHQETIEPKLARQNGKPFRADQLMSSGFTNTCYFDFFAGGKNFKPGRYSWKTNFDGMQRLIKAGRIISDKKSPEYKRYFYDFPVRPIDNLWSSFGGASDPVYVVQTNTEIVKRCILMASDPGDLVLDPTCGSGTTAYVSEQWGRRWITIDTSRVSLALARARLMGSKFEHYVLKDSEYGQEVEERITGKPTKSHKVTNSLKNGFVYKQVPHITLSSITHNAEIDNIYEKWKDALASNLHNLNQATGNSYEEFEVPIEPLSDWPQSAKLQHSEWLEARLNFQKEIDDSISRNAEIEHRFDRPYVQKDIVRVTGPFTVESLAPYRIVPTNVENEVLEDGKNIPKGPNQHLRPKSVENSETRFLDIIYENLRSAGVQNTKKDERLEFTTLEPWVNGLYVQFEGRYMENDKEKKAAVCIGPEYGTVTKRLMTKAAHEAADFFDILIILGFAFEAHADEDLLNIGKMTVLRARMNSDLHMADRLKAGKSGNLFVVFGEPDIELHETDDDKLKIEIKGIDIFDPTTGEVKASAPDEIACWFIDTDYNNEAFFVRHAYFSGNGKDPFKRLKATLKAEINEDAWETLYSTTSRAFEKPSTGRIAVKAINHYGDEVLKVFNVSEKTEYIV